MTAYYNEWDPYAVEYLKNLIAHGHIEDGVVDGRSIKDVEPSDLHGFDRHHFFAGVAMWDVALQYARWPTDRPVWTASLPCQPFSQAGKLRGVKDERHLWPYFRELVEQCRPATLIGEQVAQKAGRDWLATVRLDLEALGYAVGAADLCVSGTGEKATVSYCDQPDGTCPDCGALREWCECDNPGEPATDHWEEIVLGPPHRRQRLYWIASRRVGDDHGSGRARRELDDYSGEGVEGSEPSGRTEKSVGSGGARSGLPHTGIGGRESGGRIAPVTRHRADAGRHVGVGDRRRTGLEGHAGDGPDRAEPGRHDTESERSAAPTGLWNYEHWVYCIDGKARPVESGIQPVAHGVPARVDRLRTIGNAIVPQTAAEFIIAYLEAEHDLDTV